MKNQILFFITFFYFAFTVVSDKRADPIKSQIFDEGPDSEKAPYFASDMESHLVNIVGGSITFDCHVLEIGNKTVSWVRHKDVSLMATGRLLFQPDPRYIARHEKFSDHWYFTIKQLTVNDSGIYECQVALEEPISFRFHLKVANPRIRIVEGDKISIKEHDYLNVTCIVEDAPEVPSTVIWYRNGLALNDGLVRSGLNLFTEVGHRTRSRLTIKDMTKKDEGWFTCAPTNTEARSIYVHIIESAHKPDINHQCRTTEVNHMLMLLTPLLIIFATR